MGVGEEIKTSSNVFNYKKFEEQGPKLDFDPKIENGLKKILFNFRNHQSKIFLIIAKKSLGKVLSLAIFIIKQLLLLHTNASTCFLPVQKDEGLFSQDDENCVS